MALWPPCGGGQYALPADATASGGAIRRNDGPPSVALTRLRKLVENGAGRRAGLSGDGGAALCDEVDDADAPGEPPGVALGAIVYRPYR